MKQKPKMQSWLRPAALGLLVAGSVSLSQAQPFTNIIISSFDGTEPFASLNYWWGVNTFTSQPDPTKNNPTTLGPNVPGSGALKCTIDWTGTSGNGAGAPEPQSMVWNAFSGTQ